MKINLPEETVKAMRTFMKIAFVAWLSLIGYLATVMLHYTPVDIGARAHHNFGVMFALIIFFTGLLVLAKKEGWKLNE